MFETSTDGVVELNVRAKKYYKPQPIAYKWTITKTKITQETWDEAHEILANAPTVLKYWEQNYEVA